MREDFLKACEVDVETEDLLGEGMLGGEVFGAPNAPLPGSGGHRAIMGLGGGRRQIQRPFATKAQRHRENLRV